MAGRSPRRGRRRLPLRSLVHQRAGGRPVRHRTGSDVPLLGLGRRPLQPVLGDRAQPDGRHRRRPLPGDAGRVPHHRRALPHHPARPQPAGADGAARGVEPELPRHPDAGGAPLLPRAGPLSRLSPAARHGVQRQVGAARRFGGRCRHRPGGLGRAGHQRPARLLPAHPPGHGNGRLRLHRAVPPGGRSRRSPRQADRQPARPGRGAGLREDHRGGARRRSPPTWPGTAPFPGTGPARPSSSKPSTLRRSVS